MSDTPKSTLWAVELVERHLGMLRARDGGIIRLVQFAHDSPGLRTYKRACADALVHLLETHGRLYASLDDTLAALRAEGYTIIPPTEAHGVQREMGGI